MCSDTSRTANTLCAYPNCGRNVWQDPDGSFSAYCGNSHRMAMVELKNVDVGGNGSSGGNGRRGPAQQQLCKHCNVRPVYIENGKPHPFCGRRCALEYANGGSERAQAASPTSQSLTAVPSNTSGPNTPKCILNGCNRNVHFDNGVPTRFCSLRHRRESVRNGQLEGCLLCIEQPKAIVNGKQSDFCSRKCSNNAIDNAPVILQLDSSTEQYKDVVVQFETQWKHPTPPGGRGASVVKVWKIISTRDAHGKFSRYQLSVERVRGIMGANTKRRWHGTIRACQLGDGDSENTLCDNVQCSLCSIIKTSFQLARTGERTNFGRFGAGIYTSATSSKANDYVAERGLSMHRALLLNDVVLGKTIKLTTGDVTLTSPPQGYDSVVGEPGGDLNYDESIVYKNEAIRPAFLVIFDAGV